MNKTKLKGGSLSSTYLYTVDDKKFVRKIINLSNEREYGFMRWYSQLKKNQRYHSLMPELFPKILNVSWNNNEAYFDIEYFGRYKDLKNLLNDNLSEKNIENINKTLWESFDKLHSNSLNLNYNAISLYFKEEVATKLSDALNYKEFQNFTNYKYFFLNDIKVPNFNRKMDVIENMFSNIKLDNEEFIHGNPTLENTLYSIDDNKIIFIDLYEESIVDSQLLDYSQVLQCSRSYYGLINDNKVYVDQNKCSHSNVIPNTIKIFNNYFIKEINKRNLNQEYIDLFEASQFIRMLPFKCAIQEFDKAKYFYVHACSLFDKVLDNYG